MHRVPVIEELFVYTILRAGCHHPSTGVDSKTQVHLNTHINYGQMEHWTVKGTGPTRRSAASRGLQLWLECQYATRQVLGDHRAASFVASRRILPRQTLRIKLTIARKSSFGNWERGSWPREQIIRCFCSKYYTKTYFWILWFRKSIKTTPNSLITLIALTLHSIFTHKQPYRNIKKRSAH